MDNSLVYRYLGAGQPDEKTARLVSECVKTVKEKSRFRAVHKKYTLTHEPLVIKELGLALPSRDLRQYLSGCGECVVIACTLGFETDREIRYYQHLDMAKAVVLHRAAARYLEYKCDEYQRENLPAPYTFRFAPGYGDIPLSLNIPLSQALDAAKIIGLQTGRGGTFAPAKSMLGIVGLGKETEKDCMSCPRLDGCTLRKQGRRCYLPG